MVLRLALPTWVAVPWKQAHLLMLVYALSALVAPPAIIGIGGILKAHYNPPLNAPPRVPIIVPVPPQAPTLRRSPFTSIPVADASPQDRSSRGRAPNELDAPAPAALVASLDAEVKRLSTEVKILTERVEKVDRSFGSVATNYITIQSGGEKTNAFPMWLTTAVGSVAGSSIPTAGGKAEVFYLTKDGGTSARVVSVYPNNVGTRVVYPVSNRTLMIDFGPEYNLLPDSGSLVSWRVNGTDVPWNLTRKENKPDTVGATAVGSSTSSKGDPTWFGDLRWLPGPANR